MLCGMPINGGARHELVLSSPQEVRGLQRSRAALGVLDVPPFQHPDRGRSRLRRGNPWHRARKRPECSRDHLPTRHPDSFHRRRSSQNA